jgi:hypothetical protein
MILTEKDKFEKLYDIQAVLKCSDTVLMDEVLKLYPKEFNENGVPVLPFETIDEIKIIKGTDIRYCDFIEIADASTDDKVIKATAKPFLNIEDINEIKKLPMFKFMRLMEYGKDIIALGKELFSKIKRIPTPEEIAAGIEEIKSDDFSIIDALCLRNGISDRNIGAEIPWIIVYRCFEEDFKRDSFARRYSEVIERKNKKK